MTTEENTHEKNTIVIYGAQKIVINGVEQRIDGADIKIIDGTAQQPVENLEIGQLMKDGTVYAGNTSDGIYQIYAMPEDLDVALTFNKAVKAVHELSSEEALGHDDWQIGSLDVLKVLFKNQDKGALKNSFNTVNEEKGFECRDWYCSSEISDNIRHRGYIERMRFSDGVHGLVHSDNARLSCRPVRLVPVNR